MNVLSPIRQGEEAERLMPWGQEPGRLWSLWDMLDKHGSHLTKAIGLLGEVKWISAHSARESSEDDASLRQQISNVGQRAIHDTRRACILSDMDQVLPELDRVSGELSALVTNPAFDMNTVALSLKHLISRMHDDLENEFYFHLDQRDVRFYGQKELFGEKVSRKFGKSIPDIEAAGNCLALQQPTACVFHLMRVMESGVKRLGKKLNVQIDPEIEPWAKILDHVDNAINGSPKRGIPAMPSATAAQKKRKAQYAEACSFLNNVRLAGETR